MVIMTLLIGYEAVRDASGDVAGGGAKSADFTMPDGPAHAVESGQAGEQRSICGEVMQVVLTEREWPPPFGSQCPTCSEKASGGQ
jgi:hypothetical protein